MGFRRRKKKLNSVDTYMKKSRIQFVCFLWSSLQELPGQLYLSSWKLQQPLFLPISNENHKQCVSKAIPTKSYSQIIALCGKHKSRKIQSILSQIMCCCYSMDSTNTPRSQKRNTKQQIARSTTVLNYGHQLDTATQIMHFKLFTMSYEQHLITIKRNPFTLNL